MKNNLFLRIATLLLIMQSSAVFAGQRAASSTPGKVRMMPTELNVLKQFSPKNGKKLLTDLDSCNAKADPPCAKGYASQTHKTWLLEVCRASGENRAGLYLGNAKGFRWYPWFDKTHFEWACAEKCSEPDGCSYEVTEFPNGQVKRLKYSFDINLSHGSYDLKIEPKEIKVLGKTLSKDPS